MSNIEHAPDWEPPEVPWADDRLRDIARKHGLTADMAEQHRAEVWANRHGKCTQLPVIHAAWSILPGHYCYYDAALRMSRVLRDA